MKTEEDGGGKLKLRNFLRLTMELRGRAEAVEAHRKEKKKPRQQSSLEAMCTLNAICLLLLNIADIIF